MKILTAFAVYCLLCQGCVSTTNPSIPPQSDADAAVVNLNLGLGYLRQGRPELAIDIFNRALSFDPDLADAHSSIAVAYGQVGRSDEAEGHYQRAAELTPDNLGAANSYAVYLCRTNRWAEAEPYFRQAAENPTYTTPEAALSNAGLCALASGEPDKAESYFREALGRNPVYPDVLYHMADLAHQQGNLLQARAFMQRSFASVADSPEMLWLCIQIEGQLSSPTQAQACATRLKGQFPEPVQASQLFELERDAAR
jgi:type IV pilus assembly protein PilF